MSEKRLLSAEDVEMLREEFGGDLYPDVLDLADRLEETLRLFTAEDVEAVRSLADDLGPEDAQLCDLADALAERLSRLVQEDGTDPKSKRGAA